MQDFIEWLKNEDISSRYPAYAIANIKDTLVPNHNPYSSHVPSTKRHEPKGPSCKLCGAELENNEVATYGDKCEDCIATGYQKTNPEKDMNHKKFYPDNPSVIAAKRKMDMDDHDYEYRPSVLPKREKRKFRTYENQISESDSRYSVEVNYRTGIQEVLKNYAKICLGYASAGLKRQDYHVRQVFEESPFRILVSSRNWDDGEWVGVVSWNESKHCYVVSCGFYNKDRKTVSIQKSLECDATNASEIVKEVVNLMHGLKDQPDKHVEKMKRVSMKRGRKK